jgi:hypothetical protein
MKIQVFWDIHCVNHYTVINISKEHHFLDGFTLKQHTSQCCIKSQKTCILYLEENPFYLPLTGPDICQISNTLDYQIAPTLTIFLRSIFFFFSQPAMRECALVSYFHFIVKRLNFFIYHRFSHWFFFGTQWCKPLIKHPVQLLKYKDFWPINRQTERDICISAISQ